MRILVKLGGRAIERKEQRELLTAESRKLRELHELILVHGGGHRVTALAERLGISSRFVDGVRMTGDQEMEVVDMVLAGAVNTELVRELNAASVPAVGLTGADARLVTGAPVHDENDTPSHTGVPAAVDPAVVEALLRERLTPVCGSVAAGEDGRALNINADSFALALARALGAQMCLFISDTPGVLLDDRVQPVLDRVGVEEAIEAGGISGGMIPKVRSAISALDAGAAAAVIGSLSAEGDLAGMIEGTRGTRIQA